MRAWITTIALLSSSCAWAGPAVPMPSFGADVPEDIQAWGVQAWPSAVAACPGLSRYASDLRQGKQAGYFVRTYYFADKTEGALLVATLNVADSPKSRAVIRHKASGHTCFFGLTYPAADALYINKVVCARLCLDQALPDSGLESDVRVPLSAPSQGTGQ